MNIDIMSAENKVNYIIQDTLPGLPIYRQALR